MAEYHERALLLAQRLEAAGIRVSPSPPHTNAFRIHVEREVGDLDERRVRAMEQERLRLSPPWTAADNARVVVDRARRRAGDDRARGGRGGRGARAGLPDLTPVRPGAVARRRQETRGRHPGWRHAMSDLAPRLDSASVEQTVARLETRIRARPRLNRTERRGGLPVRAPTDRIAG